MRFILEIADVALSLGIRQILSNKFQRVLAQLPWRTGAKNHLPIIA
jgi:hypothetical protein